MNKLIIFSILFGLMFFNCTQPINFEKEYLTQQIVLNSIINPDSLITVKLFSSISINEGYPDCIVDAEILLYENGVFAETLKSTYSTKKNLWYPYEDINEYDTTYFYQSVKTKAMAGHEYKLVVNHPQFKTLSCETTIPAPVQITLRDTSYLYEKGKYTKEVLFSFLGEIAEPANSDDYYRMVIYETGRQKSFRYNSDEELIESFVEINSRLSIQSNDPVFRSETEDANNHLLASSYNSYGVFTDRLFNGENYALSFDARNGYVFFGNESSDTIFWNTFQEGEYFHFTIELHHITKDTYLYLKSIDAQQGIDHLPFVEPVQIYSNVENGAGIFGSYSVAKTEVVFGKKPVEDDEEP